MIAHYQAEIHKNQDSDFGVSFPDFPGCVTAGKTLDEALSNAEEALQLHVDGMIADGKQIPPAAEGEVFYQGQVYFIRVYLP